MRRIVHAQDRACAGSQMAVGEHTRACESNLFQVRKGKREAKEKNELNRGQVSNRMNA